MSIKKSSANNTLIQIVVFLVLAASLLFYKRSAIASLITSGSISTIGLIINGIIVLLFLGGMLRIVMVLFRYIDEHHAVVKAVKSLKTNQSNPFESISSNYLISQRYNKVGWISKQGAPINQAALASGINAAESTRLTFIRFVHSTLILAGVFGTVVSLSMALVGVSGLLNSPEGVKEMGTIISSMSSALSSTVAAIVCFFIFAYFYLRLNDSRVQLLNAIEETTSLYILPKFSQTEEGLISQVSELTASLNLATERLLTVQNSFNQAGLSLQTAVDDLQSQVQGSSLNEIKSLLRKGFHLSEPVYEGEKTSLNGQQDHPLKNNAQSTPLVNAEIDLVTTDKGTSTKASKLR